MAVHIQDAVSSISSIPPTSTSLKPPATRTWLFGSNVAVAKERLFFMLPVTVQIPVAGSYSSVLVPLMASPPATSTCPLAAMSPCVCCARRACCRSPSTRQSPDHIIPRLLTRGGRSGPQPPALSHFAAMLPFSRSPVQRPCCRSLSTSQSTGSYSSAPTPVASHRLRAPSHFAVRSPSAHRMER